MGRPGNIPLVTTIKERCRVCYTCVRECPAKAIRIAVGQAEVIPERCIGCGNCIRVCSQHAKHVYSSINEVSLFLTGGEKVAACIAPSFPAEFIDIDYKQLVGMIRALGFSFVNEVAFGADLVAEEYHKLLSETNGKRYITTTCPAIVDYIERYHPGLVSSLAPIVSPMIAEARVLRRLHGSTLKVVFIGPCIAKKGEAESINLKGEIDAALSFVELRQMFSEKYIIPHSVEPAEFDPPYAGRGALFPINRGLLQAANITEDLLSGNVVATDGRSNFVEGIKEFEAGDMNAKLLEVLACNGCIMGPGMSSQSPLSRRRSQVSQYVRERIESQEYLDWLHQINMFIDLDLTRQFTPNDQRIPIPSENELTGIMRRMGKFKHEDELNCGACGYETCYEHAVAIYKGLAENEMCLPYSIEQLRKTVKELAVSNEELATIKEALIQSEKLASMGQLAAGIAHEVNNPLGVVLMYAHLILEGCNPNSRLHEDLELIVEQADRCKKIVSGLLHFARQNKVVLRLTNVCELIERCLKTIQRPANVAIHSEYMIQNPMVNIDRDQIIQVMTNLMTNGITAMPDGGALTIRVDGDTARVAISVIDTGIGIPKENLSKIFEPFFTTKQIGMGTGLGLAVTYGIVKMHRGDIMVKSNSDTKDGATGSTFIVTLPRNEKE